MQLSDELMEQQINFIDNELENLQQPFTKEAAEFFTFITKAVKARLVYPSSSKLPSQFKEELASKAEEIFQGIDNLDYKITSNSILYGDATVYESNSRSENFAHIFFRDGLIGLNFKKGVNLDELSRFIDLLAKMLRAIYIDDDLATLFWEENFQYISYDLIDDGLEIDTVEYTVDSFRSENKASDEDIQLLFRDEGEITFEDGDLDSEIGQTGQKLYGSAYSNLKQETHDFLNHVTEFTPEEKNQILEILAEDAKFDHTEYLLVVIFEILGMEKEIPGYVEVLGFIGKVRDNFIQLGNFSGASALLNRMHEMLDVLRNLSSRRAEKIEAFFLECASSKKIELITKSANTVKDLDAESLVSYLKQLPWAAIDPLLTSLGELKDYKARRAVCSVLAELGADQIDLIARGLEDERWYVVRNVVMVLGEIANPKIINYLKKTIRHPDYRVRKQTLAAAAKIESSDSDDFMILALSDLDVQIQISSLNYLIKSGCKRAYKAIEHIIKNKKFKDRPPEQIRKYFEGYAVLGGGKALEYLRSIATKKLFFASGKEERLKIFAIEALAKIRSAQANKILNKISRGRNSKLASAAMRALTLQRKKEEQDA